MPRRFRTPYDEDDLDISTRRPYYAPSKAGLHALLSSLGSFALLAIIVILAVVVNEIGSVQASGLILILILFLDMVAFAASLMGLILGFRAQQPENTLYRTHGVLGVIGGIIGLLASLAVGLVAMCIGLFLAAVQNVPGG